MKNDTFLFWAFPFILALFLAGAASICAHPFEGVVQKTVVSDLADEIVIEYISHFKPEVVLTLHPDKDFNGVLDGEEQQQFLNRAHQRFFPNISCTMGSKKLDLMEVERSIALADGVDFKNGLNTTFVWRVVPVMEEGEVAGPFRIRDGNFKPGETDRLSYVVKVLGSIGPMNLQDGGRELVLDLTAEYRASTRAETDPADSIAISSDLHHSAMADNNTESEADSLIAFLKNGSGGVKIYLVGLFTAFILGAFHALSPGHGKAMVAAYLVGTRGRVSDAVRLGAVVTLTHVISVLILGVLALVLSRYTLSEDFYPWLGVASGLLIFLTGYFLLARMALASGTGNNHHHHDHHHDDGHSHGEDFAGDKVGDDGSRSLKAIISLGVAGGLVPCPSAIVILLFAVAVNRIVTGLLLILSFSLGLAAVLIMIGILTVTASKRLERIGASVGWIKRLPVFTAGIIMVLGVAICLNTLYQAGILSFNL